MSSKQLFVSVSGLVLCVFVAWAYGHARMKAYSASVPDFGSYYWAAKAWQNGANPYVLENLSTQQTDTTMGEPFPYLYTPLTAQAVRQLTHLRFAQAARVWGTGLVVTYGLCLFLCGLLCYRMGIRLGWIPESAFQKGLWIFVMALLGLVFPYAINLECGQVNIFILLFLLFYLLLYIDEKPFLSGMALGMASALKIVPVFLLLAHTRSSRSFWGGFLAGVLLLLCVSVIGFGFIPWLQFWEALPHFSYGTRVEGLWEISIPYNIALSGKFARLFNDDARLIFLAGISAGVLLLVYYLYTAKRVADDSPAFFLRMGAALVLMLLFSPIAYVHHLVWLFPVAAMYGVYVLRGSARYRLGSLLLLVLALFLSLYDFTVHYYEFPLTAHLPFYFSVNTVGLLLLAGLLLYSANRRVNRL